MATPASAKSVYLIQLGSYPTRSEAEKKWQEIKDKESTLLGSLSLRVAEVALPPDNFVVYRTQAGPISTRAQAEDYCKKIMADHIECFVVETAMFVEDMPAVAANLPPPPSSSAATTSSGATSLSQPPAVGNEFASAVAQNPASSGSSSSGAASNANPPSHLPPLPSPSLLQDTPPAPAAAATPLPPLTPPAAPAAPKPQPAVIAPVTVAQAQPVKPVSSQPVAAAPAAAPKGTVNVAEAIRVPLSDSSKHKKTITRVIQHGSTYPVAKGYPSQNSFQKTVWAQIGFFGDRDEAVSFWNDFQDRNPDITDGVRVRITQPFVFARSGGHISLRVGPYTSLKEVRAVCGRLAMGGNNELRCPLRRIWVLQPPPTRCVHMNRLSLMPIAAKLPPQVPRTATGSCSGATVHGLRRA